MPSCALLSHGIDVISKTRQQSPGTERHRSLSHMSRRPNGQAPHPSEEVSFAKCNTERESPTERPGIPSAPLFSPRPPLTHPSTPQNTPR
ncbi:hypothetical protein VTH06DRAFT_6143 [Thermothelomyces fergusii]